MNTALLLAAVTSGATFLGGFLAIRSRDRLHLVLGLSAGFKSATVGQNLDDPTLWVLTTEWENVGSYRRALSSTRAKLEAIPVLARAIDEPGAYE